MNSSIAAPTCTGVELVGGTFQAVHDVLRTFRFHDDLASAHIKHALLYIEAFVAVSAISSAGSAP